MLFDVLKKWTSETLILFSLSIQNPKWLPSKGKVLIYKTTGEKWGQIFFSNQELVITQTIHAYLVGWSLTKKILFKIQDGCHCRAILTFDTIGKWWNYSYLKQLNHLTVNMAGMCLGMSFTKDVFLYWLEVEDGCHHRA